MNNPFLLAKQAAIICLKPIWAVFSAFKISIFLCVTLLVAQTAYAQGIYYSPSYGFQQTIGPWGLPSQPRFFTYYPGNLFNPSISAPFFGSQIPGGFFNYSPVASSALTYNTFPRQSFSVQPYPINSSFSPYTPLSSLPIYPAAIPYQNMSPQVWGGTYNINPLYNSFPSYNNTFLPSYMPYRGLNQPDLGSYQPNSQQTPDLPRPETLSEYPIPDDIPQKRKTALKDALDWIFENPTEFSNNTSVEVGEEVILFYQLYRRAGTQKAKDLCREYITARIQEIVNAGRLNNPTDGELSVLVPICGIMDKLDLDLFDYVSFINQKVLYNPGTYTITHKTWNTSVLERLGFSPPTPLIQLVSQGWIAQEVKSGQLMRLMDYPDADELFIMTRFYDIAHEIIPLTDFGERPITLLDSWQISYVKDLIIKGLDYFLERPDVDILSELLICASMLGVTDMSLLDSAYQFIIDQQIEDGSFGNIDRLTEIGRSSPSRHVVFVAVWALIQ